MKKFSLLVLAALALLAVSCSPEVEKPVADVPSTPRAKTEEELAAERFEATAERARIHEKRAQVAMDGGHYQRALEEIEAAEAVWREEEYSTVYDRERIEALLGLKKYQEVLEAAGPERKPGDVMLSTAVAISLLKTGDEEGARKMYAEQFLLQYLPPLSRRLLPEIKSAKQFEAALHTSRGVEMYFTGNASRASIELEQAEKLNPGQPLNSYFLGKLLMLKGDRDRAKDLLASASQLSGSLGVEAKQLLKEL